MSRFHYLTAIALVVFVACLHRIGAGMSLDGSVACDTLTCGSGQVCISEEDDGGRGGTADPSYTYSCATPPASCSLTACAGQGTTCGEGGCCPACLVDLCPYAGDAPGTPSYDGERTLYCGATF